MDALWAQQPQIYCRQDVLGYCSSCSCYWSVSQTKHTKELENAQPFQHMKPSNSHCAEKIWIMPNHKRDTAKNDFTNVTCPPGNNVSNRSLREVAGSVASHHTAVWILVSNCVDHVKTKKTCKYTKAKCAVYSLLSNEAVGNAEYLNTVAACFLWLVAEKSLRCSPLGTSDIESENMLCSGREEKEKRYREKIRKRKTAGENTRHTDRDKEKMGQLEDCWCFHERQKDRERELKERGRLEDRQREKERERERERERQREREQVKRMWKGEKKAGK